MFYTAKEQERILQKLEEIKKKMDEIEEEENVYEKIMRAFEPQIDKIWRRGKLY